MAIAVFSTEGSGKYGSSDKIRIDPEKEQYIVNLKLKDYSFEPTKTYQVGVSLFGQQLGTNAFLVVSK